MRRLKEFYIYAMKCTLRTREVNVYFVYPSLQITYMCVKF